MNKDTMKGDWNILKGKVKETWGNLTDDDLTEINGQKEQLLGALQKRYGYAKEVAEKEYSAFEKSCNSGCGCSKKACDDVKESKDKKVA